jgi:hypothetical protein
MSKLGGFQCWSIKQFMADVKARWKTNIRSQPTQKIQLGRIQSWADVKHRAEDKAGLMSKLSERQCRADVKESWVDVKVWRKTQLGRCQSWADVKAGQKTMLGGCQRKLGGCQSSAEAKGDQNLKLNETSPQVNLRKCMCIRWG